MAWSPRDTGTLTRIGFLGNPVAFRCVKIIAEAAAAVPVVVQDATGGSTCIRCWSCWRRRTRGRGARRCSRVSTGTCCCPGTAISRRPGRSLRRAAGALLLRSDRMKVVPGADGWPVAYEYALGGRKHVFDMRQERVPVLHVKSFHPPTITTG